MGRYKVAQLGFYDPHMQVDYPSKYAVHCIFGGYAKNPSMEEAYDDCKPTKRILLVCKDLYII